MKTLVSAVTMALMTASAFAHPSVVAHEHPHGVSWLPDVAALLMAVRVMVGAGVILFADIQKEARQMIPGEMFIADGEIELNAGRKTVNACLSANTRRPADPGRLALSFLRDQSGAEIRSQESARHAARYRRRHGGAFRAGADARCSLAARRQAHDLWLPRRCDGKL